MIGKRLVNTGTTLAPFDPLQNFETVTYTGNGGTQKITGYIRKGAAFNGSSSYITTSLDFDSLTDYSISMWVYISATPSATGIFAGTIQNSGALNGIYLGVQTDRTIRFFERNSSTSITPLTSTDAINAGSWNHILAVRNGGTNLLYINNGTAVSTSNATITHAEDFTIGRGGAHTSSLFEGKIDQVRIFSKALSSSEVTTLYNETYGSSTKSTTDIFGDGSGVALYELDEDALSSNFEQAAVFNGNNSKIDVGNQSWFDSDFTLSMWFYPQNVSGTGFEVLIYKRAPVGDYENPLGLGLYQPNHSTNAQKIGYSMGGGGTTFNSLFASNTYNVNSWNHVAIKISGTAMSITLNGTETTATFTGTRQTNTAEIRFGNKYGTDGDYPFYGKLDQIRVFDSALSSSDITKLKNEASDIPTTYLIAHYKLDGDVTDETGTYNGTPASITYTTGVYGGTPTNVNFLGMAFQPNLVWVKNRDSNGENHQITDIVSGFGKALFSNLTNQQVGSDDTYYTELSNGFSINTNNNNILNNDYVAWCWKAGGAAVSNTDGTITSQVSANTEAGFSVCSYTGLGSDQSFGHGLSAAPEMVIIKRLDNTSEWNVHLKVLGTNNYLNLNTTAVLNNSTIRIHSTDSTVVNVGGSSNVNGNGGTYVSYCFHSVDEYQKVGSYQGNSSAVFVLTGFRPRFILLKSAETAGTSWFMVDSERGFGQFIRANTSDSESFLSSYIIPSDTGFTVSTTSTSFNELNKKYIYLAIA